MDASIARGWGWPAPDLRVSDCLLTRGALRCLPWILVWPSDRCECAVQDRCQNRRAPMTVSYEAVEALTVEVPRNGGLGRCSSQRPLWWCVCCQWREVQTSAQDWHGIRFVLAPFQTCLNLRTACGGSGRKGQKGGGGKQVALRVATPKDGSARGIRQSPIRLVDLDGR